MSKKPTLNLYVQIATLTVLKDTELDLSNFKEGIDYHLEGIAKLPVGENRRYTIKKGKYALSGRGYEMSPYYRRIIHLDNSDKSLQLIIRNNKIRPFVLSTNRDLELRSSSLESANLLNVDFNYRIEKLPFSLVINNTVDSKTTFSATLYSTDKAVVSTEICRYANLEILEYKLEAIATLLTSGTIAPYFNEVR